MRKGMTLTLSGMAVAAVSALGVATLPAQPVSAWANEQHEQQQPPQPQPKNLPNTGPKEEIAVVVGTTVVAVVGYEAVVLWKRQRQSSARPMNLR